MYEGPNQRDAAVANPWLSRRPYYFLAHNESI
jgi:hypothetical protein